MLILVVRSAVWAVAFFVYASLEKPAESGFADLRRGAPGWIGLGLIAAGAGLGRWSMLWIESGGNHRHHPPRS